MVLILPKNADFLQRNADFSKIKAMLQRKGKMSETTDVCVFRHRILSFSHSRNSRGDRVILPHPLPQNRLLDNPPRLITNIRSNEKLIKTKHHQKNIYTLLIQ